MTVVASIISLYGTAHASDSFITKFTDSGTRQVLEDQQTKIVPVRHWRGAIVYYGLAEYPPKCWSTLRWLQGMAAKASQSTTAEHYATSLAKSLQRELTSMGLLHNPAAGIGMHFSAYEYVDREWIPELFHITNWSSTDYSAVRPGGVISARRTYPTIAGTENETSDPIQTRLAVREFLRTGKFIVYNNGDPHLFNPVANAIFQGLQELSYRHAIAGQDHVRLLRALSITPVQVVSNFQRDFCTENARLVGGRPHNISITPEGLYQSDTGDSA